MLNIAQFVRRVVSPTLMMLEGRHGGSKWHTRASVQLIVGTGLVESKLSYIEQIKGPALGIYQMEPATIEDIMKNYVAFRPLIKEAIDLMVGVWPVREVSMIGNLYYATAMCRIHYRRVPEPIPVADDIEAQGAYWKKHYNTVKGKGTVEKYVNAWESSKN